MCAPPGKHVLVESICEIMQVTLVGTLRAICSMRYTLIESYMFLISIRRGV